MYVASGIIISISIFVTLINYLQEHKKHLLPRVLEDWRFLPKPLRTLGTLDYVVQTYMEVYCCCFVRRTVAAVPVIGGRFYNKKKDTLFGIDIKLSGGHDMELVKIDRNSNLPQRCDTPEHPMHVN